MAITVKRNSKSSTFIFQIYLLSYISTLYSVKLTLKRTEQLFHGVFLTAIAVKRHDDQGSAYGRKHFLRGLFTVSEA